MSSPDRRTRRSWYAMRERCFDASHPSFARYGGRGIGICERWHSLEAFLADMGIRPEGKTLDRWPDRDGDYEPGNCRWATPAEQIRNRDYTVFIDGMTQLEYSRAVGIPDSTLSRWRRQGRELPGTPGNSRP